MAHQHFVIATVILFAVVVVTLSVIDVLKEPIMEYHSYEQIRKRRAADKQRRAGKQAEQKADILDLLRDATKLNEEPKPKQDEELILIDAGFSGTQDNHSGCSQKVDEFLTLQSGVVGLEEHRDTEQEDREQEHSEHKDREHKDKGQEDREHGGREQEASSVPNQTASVFFEIPDTAVVPDTASIESSATAHVEMFSQSISPNSEALFEHLRLQSHTSHDHSNDPKENHASNTECSFESVYSSDDWECIE